jgi:hypothetical protein
MKKKNEKIYMKPGRNNAEDRLNFVKYWANYVKTHEDEEWSKQQNMLINSQINKNPNRSKLRGIFKLKMGDEKKSRSKLQGIRPILRN